MDAKWVEWVKNFRGGKRFLKENLMAYVEIGAAGKVCFNRGGKIVVTKLTDQKRRCNDKGEKFERWSLH